MSDDQDTSEEIAQARSDGRSGSTPSIFDSAEVSDAKEQGANEQRTADAAEKTADAAAAASEKDD